MTTPIGTIVETYNSVMTTGFTNLYSSSPNFSHSRLNGPNLAGQTAARTTRTKPAVSHQMAWP